MPFNPLRKTASATAATATLLLATTVLTPLVPTDIEQPGTQPLELPHQLADVTNCDNCHGGFDAQVEPAHTWRGSPMAHAGRDPLFWGALALTEQVYNGAGDLCLRCHAPRGWIEGRSTPSDGTALLASDDEGVECALCHRMVKPDGSEHPGVQFAPYLAHDGNVPPEGWYGSGMYVLYPDRMRLGPYSDGGAARHPWLQSRFHRESEMCATCHDVSNPLVGDLAPNNGAELPLPPGTFSGVPNTPVTGKAAFNHAPFAYGAVERTSSEHAASAFATRPVSDYPNLPEELKEGIVAEVYDAALLAGRGGDYADGTTRTFSCQTCHMTPAVGRGSDRSGAPVRRDLPRHDQTGGNDWLATAVQWLDARGRLHLGGGLTAGERSALDDGADRARAMLESAATLSVVGDRLRVVNLTGHKLLTGFPEGRRMWLRVRWHDRNGNLLRVDGDYGNLQVTHRGQALQVASLRDLHDPRLHVYEAKPGITKEWAAKLLTVGMPAGLVLEYDRLTGQPGHTLGQLAAQPAGTAWPTFHFALNNTFVRDSRIPPWGYDHDEALRRNARPAPPDQFGDPGPGGTYDHWDDVLLDPPVGAVTAEIELLHQTTSWEYVQFLDLANDASVPALATVGTDLLDAWLGTGMAAPHEMAETLWCVERGTREDLVLHTEVADQGEPDLCRKEADPGDRLALEVLSPDGTFDGAIAALLLQVFVPANRPIETFPGLWIDRVDAQIAVPALPATGLNIAFQVPQGVHGIVLRAQGAVLAPAARNGLFATSDAHDIEVR